MQKRIINNLDSQTAIINRVQDSGYYSGQLGPLFIGDKEKEYTAYRYAIRESVIIRAGSLVEG